MDSTPQQSRAADLRRRLAELTTETLKIEDEEVTSGTATSALAHPREVFRSAVQNGATAIACVHNHPSGDPAPWSADVQVTRQLRDASRTMDIELLDHVILGEAAADPTSLGIYSFRQAGIL